MTASEDAIEISPQPWDRLRELTEGGDGLALQAYLQTLEPAETVRAIFRLDTGQQQALVSMLSPDLAADLLEDLPDSHAADLIECLAVERAADIVEEFTSDHGADVLSEMDLGDAEAILKEMIPEIAGEVRDLISYPPDVAGGLMGAEHYAYPRNARVADFLRDLRQKRGKTERLPQRILLLDPLGAPAGAVDLADVLLAEPHTRLSEMMREIKAVSVNATLEELEDHFDRHETLGAPVIDDAGRLVGRVRRRVLYEALAEREQEDHLKAQGIIGEELRAMPVLTRSRRRLSWLSVNVVLNIVAASVIAIFQDTVSAVIALAVFLPIVSDMSGCSGNQAVAVSMRELTLGIVQPRDVLRVWWQEVSVGILNGLALGCLLALATYLWQGSPLLGIVVGIALALNTLVAVSIGGTVPLLLKGWRADPAVASGPVLTTITDMCGFFLVLGLATLALPWLAP